MNYFESKIGEKIKVTPENAIHWVDILSHLQENQDELVKALRESPVAIETKEGGSVSYYCVVQSPDEVDDLISVLKKKIDGCLDEFESRKFIPLKRVKDFVVNLLD